MERFTLKQGMLGDDYWFCTDQTHGIICGFEHGKFSDTRKFAMLHDVEQPDAHTLKGAIKEMDDWLRENHHEKI